jgi:hypothetical protein
MQYAVIPTYDDMERTMTLAMLHAAIRNNALWCNAVCTGQGSPGEFSSTLWFHRQGTPPFYPDAVTLTDDDDSAEQEEMIAALIRYEEREWSVKDSYCSLDLGHLGFEILFEAEWIGINYAGLPKLAPSNSLKWRPINENSGLQFWEREWSKGNPSKMRQIFTEQLLGNPDIVFLLAFAGDLPCGGGILFRGAGAAGISNVFALDGWNETIWQGLLFQATQFFPRLPVVGYEHGTDLATASRAGFMSLRPLRIWLRA